jgi:hypothetical protein
MRDRPIAVLVLFSALLVPGQLRAQFTSSLGGTFNNPGSALIGTMIANRMLADAARKAPRPDTALPGARETPETAPASARLTFRPVAPVLMVDELATTLVKDASAQRELRAAFRSYLRDFDGQARKDGEPSNDVARAAAFFVMVNYMAATGREPTDAQADGAQAIFRAGLAASEPFGRMEDRDRQRLYESLVILGTFPGAAAMQAGQGGNRAQEKMFREFAAELVKTLLGVPVEKIRLTRNGFRIE